MRPLLRKEGKTRNLGTDENFSVFGPQYETYNTSLVVFS